MIFVTGIESFIGRVLRRLLADKGFHVTGIDAVVPTWDDGYVADIRNPRLGEFIEKHATVIHLAAVSTSQACNLDPLEAIDVNVAGTINVTKAALAKDCRQFIFASTEWVYPNCSLPQDEESEVLLLAPCDTYAWTKRCGEELLTASGLDNVTTLRFGIAYGPRDRNWCAVEKIADDVLHNRDVVMGSLKTARRFIHVSDLCSGIAAAVGREGHETFNLSGDRLVTLGEIAEVAQELTGNAVNVREEGGAASVRNPDSGLARRELGWSPQVGLRDGMASVIEYLREKR